MIATSPEGDHVEVIEQEAIMVKVIAALIVLAIGFHMVSTLSAKQLAQECSYRPGHHQMVKGECV